MTDWGDLDALPERKRSPFGWFWGAGLLLALIATVGAGWWIRNELQELQDPENKWRELRWVLPHVFRPEGWQMQPGMSLPGPKSFSLKGSTAGGRRVHVRIKTASSFVAELFERDDPDLQPWTPPGATEPLIRIPIQGEERAIVRVTGDARLSCEEDGSSFELDVDEPSLIVDVTPSGDGGCVLLIWSSDPLEEVTPEEIQTFLSAFEIVPD